MRRYAPVSFTQVSVTGPFWKERLETVRTRTVPSQYQQLGSHGILDSLEPKSPVQPLRIPRNRHNFTTQIFWDSDIGKWIEAASYVLAGKRDASIEKKIDGITELLGKGQLADGYLNFWYIGREPEKRWTNLRDNHELYCAGHLLEGAIAYHRATGKRKLLDILIRYVELIAKTFGPGEGQKHGYCGHQEIEIALFKLYHETGEKKYLDLAQYFIDERGQSPHYFDQEAKARGDDPKSFWARTYEYNQSHMPVRRQRKVVGHAVRAMYMYSAMADLAAELGDKELRKACEALWKDVTSTKMYVTGGLGPSANNEGFTADYDLPNDSAYAETCASVALIFWAQRMLHLDLDGQYADVLERSLYNCTLAGLSRDGSHYYYENPLASDGRHRRWAWHTCPCCTMNVARLVASIGNYFYSTAKNEIAVNLYGGTSAKLDLGGSKVAISEMSNYPWSGEIRLNIDPERQQRFTLALRIPGWALGARAKVNGKTVNVKANTTRGYLRLTRSWVAGDRVEFTLPMPASRVFAHPLVKADQGKVALQRGPLIYCLEQADNDGVPVPEAQLPRKAALKLAFKPDLFGGAVAISARGSQTLPDGWAGHLYQDKPPRMKAAKLTAIPYYLWGNREAGPMSVWIAED